MRLGREPVDELSGRLAAHPVVPPPTKCRPTVFGLRRGVGLLSPGPARHTSSGKVSCSVVMGYMESEEKAVEECASSAGLLARLVCGSITTGLPEQKAF